MKILHINWSGDLGGAETFAYNLSVAQQQGGNDVTLAYMSKKSILGTKAESRGIKVIGFNMCCGYDMAGFMQYARFIEGESFDIIHDHNGPPVVRLSKLFSKYSTFVQHIHGTKWGNEKWENNTVLLWKKLTAGFVNQWIANSSHTKKIASDKESIPLSKISVIHNGIDLSEFQIPQNRGKIRNELDIPENDFVIGTIARLSPPKGIDKFIETAKVMQKESGIKFIIVGDGELRTEMEQQVKDSNLCDKVIFTGIRKDIPDILASFDMFLLTSDWEAFGIAILEAMAAGVPVAAFAVDGVTEVLETGYGVLIPHGDISKTAEAVRFIKTNPREQERMSQAGIKRARDFDIKNTANKILTLYSSLSY